MIEHMPGMYKTLSSIPEHLKGTPTLPKCDPGDSWASPGLAPVPVGHGHHLPYNLCRSVLFPHLDQGTNLQEHSDDPACWISGRLGQWGIYTQAGSKGGKRMRPGFPFSCSSLLATLASYCSLTKVITQTSAQCPPITMSLVARNFPFLSIIRDEVKF